MVVKPYHRHLTSAEMLVTPYEATRKGFVSLALERNRQATAFVQQARTLKVAASEAARPIDLLLMKKVEPALLVAAGISDKAIAYLQAEDKQDALLSLIHEYLEPQGENWIEELVYRFLLTRGDTIGGMMRNIAGTLAQRRLTRFILSAFAVQGMRYQYLDNGSNSWLPQPEDDIGIELRVRGLSWNSSSNQRTLVYNCKIPTVGKNIDLCLFNCSPNDFAGGRILRERNKPSGFYIALGELKGVSIQQEQMSIGKLLTRR